MLELTNAQKRYLKTLAHPRQPIVIIGAQGLHAAVLHEVQAALEYHELIKVRVNAEQRGAREALIAELCAATEAVLVQKVGHVATLFRRNVETPRIVWPE